MMSPGVLFPCGCDLFDDLPRSVYQPLLASVVPNLLSHVMRDSDVSVIDACNHSLISGYKYEDQFKIVSIQQGQALKDARKRKLKLSAQVEWLTCRMIYSLRGKVHDP